MRVELSSKCENCWNVPAIDRFAKDMTEQEEAARQAPKQAKLEVEEGKVCCEGPQVGPRCAAYVLISTVEFKGLKPDYEHKTLPGNIIPKFAPRQPK